MWDLHSIPYQCGKTEGLVFGLVCEVTGEEAEHVHESELCI